RASRGAPASARPARRRPAPPVRPFGDSAPAPHRARQAGREHLVAARRVEPACGMEEAAHGGRMMAWRLEGQAIALAWTLAAVACGKGTRGDQTGAADGSGAPSDPEPPVALNGDSPLQYPPRLYDTQVEGDVVLRLVVDSAGRLLSESTT